MRPPEAPNLYRRHMSEDPVSPEEGAPRAEPRREGTGVPPGTGQGTDPVGGSAAREEAGPEEGAGAEPQETGPAAGGDEAGHDAYPGGGEPRRLDSRVLPVWWLAALVRAAVVTVAAVFVDGAVLAEMEERPLPPNALWVGAAAVALVVAAARPPLRYRSWRYALREHDLWIRRGILWVTVSVIPYRRLQFVDTDQGPLLRAFGLAELIVHTAAPGTSGRIPGLDADEAEGIRERLATLAPDHDAPT